MDFCSQALSSEASGGLAGRAELVLATHCELRDRRQTSGRGRIGPHSRYLRSIMYATMRLQPAA